MTEFLHCVTYKDCVLSNEPKEASFTSFDEAYSFAKDKALASGEMVLFWIFSEDEEPKLRYLNIRDGELTEYETTLPTPTQH